MGGCFDWINNSYVGIEAIKLIFRAMKIWVSTFLLNSVGNAFYAKMWDNEATKYFNDMLRLLHHNIPLSIDDDG